jgi:hypothetical protein
MSTDGNSAGISSKIKHYSVNAAIILFAVISLYLIYNIYLRATTPQSEFKTNVTDSVTRLTKQPTGTTLQIDVQNGCGVPGIADKFTDYLHAKGFDVVEKGNFSSSDIKTTMIIDRAGNMKNAKRVADALGISEKYVIQQMNNNYFLDATVVIGKDYEELLPFKTKNN